jgi:mono/diheme cytochrome c family protein
MASRYFASYVFEYVERNLFRSSASQNGMNSILPILSYAQEGNRQLIPRHVLFQPILWTMILLLVGCGSPAARFHGNTVYVVKQEKTVGEDIADQTLDDIADIMLALFGTPDDPHVPVLSTVDITSLLDIGKLQMSAGPVGRDEDTSLPRGLYRKHCAHCHGITGDGMGPTAVFLNPYPRDYRPGVFKFKSTPKGEKPTHEDLKHILENGISGTAMPSFRLLDDGELESLVHYVRYLSIRGEVERMLIYESSELDTDKGERLIDLYVGEEPSENLGDQIETLQSIVAGVVQKWERAENNIIPIAPRREGWNDPQTLAKSIEHGRELFYGAVANCVKCHGESALGDGQTNDYDDWTKEIEPTDPEVVHEYLAVGALPPRNTEPRNLRLGVYRGGRRPIDLFWRIRNGIDGTPMPAASLKADDAAADVKGLTTEDLWSLVDYVRSLPYESISQGNVPQLENLRERS